LPLRPQRRHPYNESTLPFLFILRPSLAVRRILGRIAYPLFPLLTVFFWTGGDGFVTLFFPLARHSNDASTLARRRPDSPSPAPIVSQHKTAVLNKLFPPLPSPRAEGQNFLPQRGTPFFCCRRFSPVQLRKAPAGNGVHLSFISPPAGHDELSPTGFSVSPTIEMLSSRPRPLLKFLSRVVQSQANLFPLFLSRPWLSKAPLKAP